MVYSTDHSKAVVPVLHIFFFAFCCFVVCSTRRFVLSLALCYFVPGFLALRFEDERANLSAFCTFVRLALVFFFFFFFFFLFSLLRRVREGLRLVIVALQGHFLTFFDTKNFTYTERKKKRRVEFFPSYFNHFLRCLL